ncbi:MAG: MFS transporter [Hydrogenophaga sp.]|nr:MFS transporter [Hydrogenophaga sp.]
MPITRLHIAAIALCSVGFAFDLLEIALGNVLAAYFSTAPRSITATELSMLLASVYVGAAIGAPALGWWADRNGRRLALSCALLWICVCSLAAAWTDSVATLTLWRSLAGLALGAFPPMVIAYLTDLLPARRRGGLILGVVCAASFGPVLGIFLIRWLTPHVPLGIEAWRWGFIAGGVGAGISGALFLLLPESPRWLVQRGDIGLAERLLDRFERSPAVQTPSNMQTFHKEALRLKDEPQATGPHARLTTAVLFLLSPWSTVAFPLLTGAIMAQKGIGLSSTLLYVGLAMFGPSVGALLSAFVIDKVERRLALSSCAIAMVLAGGFFITTAHPLGLVLATTMFFMLGFIYISALNIYAAELYPTSVRATTLSGVWALNRLGAAAAPLLLVPLLRSQGVFAVFAVITATLLASMAVLYFSPPGLQRKQVS